MKITFLGVGGAFTSLEYWQSNAFLSEGGRDKIMLIDCGGDARHSCSEQGVSASDVDAVYISHLHSDHCGGLEWLGFSTYFNPSCKKPKLFIMESLIDPLWETLKAGMRSVEGSVLELSSFFEIVPLKENSSFNWGGFSLSPFQTIHVSNGNFIVPSYGLVIETINQKTFLTTDTQFIPRQMQNLYIECDLILHDCETTCTR